MAAAMQGRHAARYRARRPESENAARPEAALRRSNQTAAGHEIAEAHSARKTGTPGDPARRRDRGYQYIADATRWMRKPRAHDSIEEALTETAQPYRKTLWRDSEDYIEVWLEKDALAGVVFPITAAFNVPLMVARGFSSETFCFEAIAAREND